MIEYDAIPIEAGGSNDRVSDLNQFWMAQERDGSPLKFTRKGVFAEYFDLKLYYVSIGGWDNTRTTFRRQNGRGCAQCGQAVGREILGIYCAQSANQVCAASLSSEPGYFLAGNQTYRIAIALLNGRITFTVNGQPFFVYDDSEPFASGYFGFRTLQSHIQIDNFRVWSLPG
ncbi:MAG: hypothetical protein HC890_05170 [Chloroflexaceae bacterium]|nr:hypothetical protein [Chloroflexaceae bacterium]